MLERYKNGFIFLFLKQRLTRQSPDLTLTTGQLNLFNTILSSGHHIQTENRNMDLSYPVNFVFLFLFGDAISDNQWWLMKLLVFLIILLLGFYLLRNYGLVNLFSFLVIGVLVRQLHCLVAHIRSIRCYDNLLLRRKRMNYAPNHVIKPLRQDKTGRSWN